jgi:acetate---CoA ligase (ADP-forming)
MVRSTSTSCATSSGTARLVEHLPVTDPHPKPTYPAEREADIVLRDGSIAHVRPVRADDEAALLQLLQGLSVDDRLLRFFSLGTNMERTAHDEVSVDYVHSYGLVVTVGPEQRLVGHALYAPTGEGRAEVAFTISREYQGQGLASTLLGQLAEAAASNGIHTFEAIAKPENRRMLDVFRESGFPVQAHFGWDVVEVSFPTELTPEGLARFEQREEQSAASALRRVLCPRSVAVIGASRREGSVGDAVVRNLLECGFRGPVYPINLTADSIRGMQCYPSVERAPTDIDLAVVAVPAAAVLDVAEQCGRKGVRALVVLSAGFAEVGLEGQQRQRQLLQVCRTYGMRLIGPNCIGVINTDPSAPLNATFGPLMPPPGRVGLATQSGALGLAAIDFASTRGLGFSSVVSMGNKADISGNDLLGYWHSDPRTDVVLLYLESFGNPRKFARFARSVGRTKPIVALKSGRSAVGARATSSHTGALLAASDVTVDALFRQSGVIRTDSLHDMLDVAQLLADQPLPKGRRVAIVTNVGGPAVICADACEAHGLEVPMLSDAAQAALRTLLPAEASVLNPVDMLAAATAEHFRDAVRIVAADPGVDAVISIFLPPLATRSEDVARSLAQTAIDKPLLAVFMSAHELPTADAGRVPLYALPEPAASALGHAARYAEWRTTANAKGVPGFPEARHRTETGQLLAEAVHRGRGWLTAGEVQRLLACYGVPLIQQRVASTPAEAGYAVGALGSGTFALKAIAPGLVHKSDAGGVRLGLATADEIKDAAEAMAARVERLTGQSPTGFLIQRMAPPGVEMLVGVVNDRQFGPTIACGAGGTVVELLNDVSVRLAPLCPADAASMVRELRSFPLLDGYRGGPRLAVGALEDVLLRIGALAEDHPQIAELDCNPVIVTTDGAVVVDARVRVEAVEPPRPLGARR